MPSLQRENLNRFSDPGFEGGHGWPFEKKRKERTTRYPPSRLRKERKERTGPARKEKGRVGDGGPPPTKKKGKPCASGERPSKKGSSRKRPGEFWSPGNRGDLSTTTTEGGNSLTNFCAAREGKENRPEGVFHLAKEKEKKKKGISRARPKKETFTSSSAGGKKGRKEIDNRRRRRGKRRGTSPFTEFSGKGGERKIRLHDLGSGSKGKKNDSPPSFSPGKEERRLTFSKPRRATYGENRKNFTLTSGVKEKGFRESARRRGSRRGGTKRGVL